METCGLNEVVILRGKAPQISLGLSLSLGLREATGCRQVGGCWKMEDRRWEMGRFRTRKPGLGKRGNVGQPCWGGTVLSPLQGLMGFHSYSRDVAPGLAISAPLGRGLRAKEGVFKLNS